MLARLLSLTGLAAVAIAATFPALGEDTQTTLSAADSRYLERNTSRFLDFAGSEKNLQSLIVGLRTGGTITLSGGSATSTTSSTTSGTATTPGTTIKSTTSTLSFDAPTRPMGYGNITRALDFASRQLAAAGIEEPTASQVRAALLGGTVSGPDGSVKLDGVLQLRSEGMGWGQIAHTLGLHPGMGQSSHAASASTGRVTNAAGGTVSQGGSSRFASAHGSGIVSAAGGAPLVHGAQGAGMRTLHANGASSASANGGGNAFGRSK